MGALEIFLLAAGGIIFVVSFILPKSREEVSAGTKELAREEIKTLVTQEMDGIRSHVDDVVGEAVEYAVEKTERSLERLTNEKIMAVNEYSDTVLQEIHKNHEEVMFLYDMLNSKHANLKNTVSEINKTVKEAEETKKEAEAVVNTFQKLNPEKVVVSMQNLDYAEAEVAESGKQAQEIADILEAAVAIGSVDNEEEQSSVDNSRTQNEDEKSRGSNERILELYKQGKSDVAIAKELGRGVGEVKLVIGLYKNM